MIWQDSTYLWLLILIPVLGAALWFSIRYYRKKRSVYFVDQVFTDLYNSHWKTGSRFRTGFLLAGLLFLVTGLAGPKIGTQVRQVKREGVDLMVALDLSASMNARDVSPSRLEKAKYELSRMLDRLNGDRVGLIVFTGDAFLQSPLTLDYSAMHMFLNTAETSQMPSATTNFAAAMATADKAFRDEDKQENNKGNNASKVLLIVSDGGNQGYDYTDDLKKLVKDHVRIYTIGIGTSQGGPIPIYNADGTLAGYKRDENGKVVTTQLEAKTLRSIAHDGHGSYYHIGQSSDSISGFLSQLNQLQKGEFGEQKFADYKNQYQTLAAIGLGLICLYIVFPQYKED